MEANHIDHSLPRTGSVRLQLRISWLYLRHWLCRRPLQLHSISDPGPIAFEGTMLPLHWHVQGCHKIVVNNRLVLPGHIRRLWLDPAQAAGLLSVRFCGIGQQVEKKFVLPEARPLRSRRLTAVQQHRGLPLPLARKLACRLAEPPGLVPLAEPVFQRSLQLCGTAFTPVTHSLLLQQRVLSLNSLTLQLPDYGTKLL